MSKDTKKETGVQAHPMTLPDALRKLAERMPEKFEFEEARSLVPEKFRIQGLTIYVPDLTSDDLDEIAGLLGWEIEVARQSDGDFWDWCYYRKGFPGKNDWHSSDPFGRDAVATKLKAAQAALIKIIEKHLETK